MNSKNAVTFQRSLDLSDEDTAPLNNLKYKIGDQFLFIADAISEDMPISKCFPSKPVIMIQDIKVDRDGIFVYAAEVVAPNTGMFKYWDVPESFLDSHFKKIDSFRMMNLDDE